MQTKFAVAQFAWISLVLAGCTGLAPGPTNQPTSPAATTDPTSQTSNGATNILAEPPFFALRLIEGQDSIEITETSQGADWFRIDIFAFGDDMRFRLNAGDPRFVAYQEQEPVVRDRFQPIQVGDRLSICFAGEPQGINPGRSLHAGLLDRVTRLWVGSVLFENVTQTCHEPDRDPPPNPPRVAFAYHATDDRLQVQSASHTTWDQFQIKTTEPLRFALNGDPVSGADGTTSNNYQPFPHQAGVSAGDYLAFCGEQPDTSTRIIVARASDGFIQFLRDVSGVQACE